MKYRLTSGLSQLRTVLVGIALISPIKAAISAPLTLGDAPYEYKVIDQDVAVALREFGSNMGIRVDVSPEVRGRLRGALPTLSPVGFLDYLARYQQLDWYFDGRVLYVTAAKESQTRVVALGPVSFAGLQSSLASLDIADSRFPVTNAQGGNVASVTGPPRYVALVEQTVVALAAEAERRRPGATRAVALPGAPEAVLTVMRGSQVSIIRGGQPDVTAPLPSQPTPRAQ